MRWFKIKKAQLYGFENMSNESADVWREAFEVSGVASVQLALTGGQLLHQGSVKILGGGVHAQLAFEWLREQRERAERKETWSLTMEVAITLLVSCELAMAVLDFVRHACR